MARSSYGHFWLRVERVFDSISANAMTGITTTPTSDDDRTKRAWYRVVLERDYLKKRGNAFQDFFADIMEKRYPGDFVRVRPWGNAGDRKNDGYLRSQRSLFQVYAPNEMTSAEATTKIEADFHGALPYWEQFFDTWIFVHNSSQGLGPDVLRTLLELSREYAAISTTSWGFEEISRVALSLAEDDLIALLGGIIAPREIELRDVSFDKLKLVLLNIARQPQIPDPDLRPVPPEKLAVSGLSADFAHLLTMGMRKSDRVAHFFAQWPDPQFGNEVVESFRQEYQALRKANLLPDVIFQELLAFTGGLDQQASDRRGAVLAVLAYLFEECEIFERPEEMPQ
jgi:hypothetical protein